MKRIVFILTVSGRPTMRKIRPRPGERTQTRIFLPPKMGDKERFAY
jgi:hypothetical protein